MKNFRKLLSLLLAMVLVFGMAACGAQGGGADGGDVALTSEDDFLGDKTFELNIGTTWSSETYAPNVMIRYMKERIEDLSDGKIKVTLHMGTLGGERELIESVQLQSVQATVVTTGPLGGFVPLAEIFMIPFLFKDFSHAYASVDGALGERVNELCQDIDLRILGWATCGSRSLVGRGSPVVEPSDLAGRKIRIMESPFLAKIYEAYGAIPTPMAYNEVFTALQQGAIDGEQTTLTTGRAGYADICDWANVLEENYQMAPIIINNTWWNSLPQEGKNIVAQAAREGADYERKLADADFALDIEGWVVNGITPVQANREAFLEIAAGLYPEFETMLDDDEGWFQWVVDLGNAFPPNIENENIDELRYGY